MFFFRQNTAYDMRISDCSSDVCSSDLSFMIRAMASNANEPADKTAPANDDALNAARDEYTIDELARVAGTTVRNVRAYQDRGLLSPPERRGRVGIYTGEHLRRLQLVNQLLGRGYTIANIQELFDGLEKGQQLERQRRGEGKSVAVRRD